MNQIKLKLLDSLMIYRPSLLNQARTFATQQNSACLQLYLEPLFFFLFFFFLILINISRTSTISLFLS